MGLTELVTEAKYVIVFTGAGLSTESGIPDFRSSSGLYLSGKYEGHTPEQILSNRFFRSNKEIFFSFYKERIMAMADKQPNRAHFALKKMQDCGKLKSVINQNIDNLIQKAGTTNVLDLHGNITTFRCLSACGKDCSQFEFMELMKTQSVPRCECGGVIRPNTVLFDEWLNDDIYDAAYHEAKNADLMIAIGSSLVVRPACTLLSEITSGCKLVILNRDETPYDKKATLIIREPCGEVLENLTKNL